MGILHLANEEGDYLCSSQIQINPNKLTLLITEVNCRNCLDLISNQDFSITRKPITQTSLRGIIFDR